VTSSLAVAQAIGRVRRSNFRTLRIRDQGRGLPAVAARL